MSQDHRHSLLEDAQALATGTLLFAFAIVLFREAGLLTGGTAGITFLAHYLSGVPFGLLYFLINIPFYVFGLLALGRAFTAKTFCAVALLSAYSELLPRWIAIERIDPVFAGVLGGLLAGAGLLMLIRHQASVGGLGVLAIYLQKKRGWRAGTVQMLADGFIVCGALYAVELEKVALSVIGAVMLNLVLTINHRPGRYFGQ
ncbi:YitT family protein [Azospira restricta]|uniref:YitT family protein n=1 Tax=Azospira restricta TaxID=404405 RepID=A0A974PWN9_9RHOO|nr:YitT family protein [Azospira restricta]QRJ62646.1 YitT family protein [Azospira restricta]